MERKLEEKLTPSIQNPRESWGGLGRFAATFYVIRVQSGLYAANNATLPDGSQVDGLACFPEVADATAYMELPTKRGITGEAVQVTFDDARDIAKSKSRLNALLLFVNGRIVEYHFVR